MAFERSGSAPYSPQLMTRHVYMSTCQILHLQNRGNGYSNSCEKPPGKQPYTRVSLSVEGFKVAFLKYPLSMHY